MFQFYEGLLSILNGEKELIIVGGEHIMASVLDFWGWVGERGKSFSGRGLLENSCSLYFEVALQSLAKCLAHNGHLAKMMLTTLNSMDLCLMKGFVTVLRCVARIISAPEKPTKQHKTIAVRTTYFTWLILNDHLNLMTSLKSLPFFSEVCLLRCFPVATTSPLSSPCLDSLILELES